MSVLMKISQKNNPSAAAGDGSEKLSFADVSH